MDGASAWEAMEHHVGMLRKNTPISTSDPLGSYLAARNVVEKKRLRGVPYDGCIEPLGSRFSDGFRLILKEGVPEGRRRFTIAHEICHTFFYELVPELKFGPHETDPFEERLCNHGAAAMLLPAPDLHQHAAKTTVSLQALETLSAQYGVSLETMFIRLRTLRLWPCELSLWHRMTNGEFVLDRIHGWKRIEWSWVDGSVPLRAWEAKRARPLNVRTFISLRYNQQCSAVKQIYCQVKRRGNTLAALWSERKFRSPRNQLPLFHRGRGGQ